MTVSVLINNYNYGRFVGRAIRSVLAQDHGPVECVVVDDGSTDDSREVIAGFAGIKPVFKPNGGQTSAVIEGLAHCTGDIVIVLDADDSLDPQACSAVARAWRDDVSLVQYRLRKVDAEGRIVGEFPNAPFLPSGHKDHLLRWGEFPASPMSGNAFSRRYLLDAMGVDIGGYPVVKPLPWTDGYMIFAAPLAGRVEVIDRVLGSYFIHGMNTSTSGGQTANALRRHIRSIVAQKKALAWRLSQSLGAQRTWTSLVSAYDWRTLAFLRRAYPEDAAALAETSLSECCLRGAWRFATEPGISPAGRAKNILALLFLPLLPLRVARAKVPEG
ncbi:MAG: glycosyltransferase family 2 protein [Alsobacter sp.]